VTEIARLIEANAAHVAAGGPGIDDAQPSRHMAVITCMDARIDVFAALGLQPGEAHVIRNAGGRVTQDVLRSLALSTNVLGVDTLVVMQHTACGLAGRTDDELRDLTGADLPFLPIDDHAAALQEDVDLLASLPYLASVGEIAGLIYDVVSGGVERVVTWRREG
jgi:carbonic anhydrase